MLPPLTDKDAFVKALLSRLEARAESKGESEAQLANRLGLGAGLFKNLRSGSLPSADRLGAILTEVDCSLTLGSQPERQSIDMIIDGGAYSHIPVHDAVLSAGPGITNGDAAVIDQLAFRTEWLTKTGISPHFARVARVHGDSMAPAIGDGDLVLIDTAKSLNDIPRRTPKDRRPAPIFAFIQDGEARVKRLERTADRLLVLLSDNALFPAETVDPVLVEFELLGQVVWSGHVWR